MNSKLAVCVLDDDDALRDSLKLLFRSKNIPFLGFASADEFFERHDEKTIGCAIIDLKMPGTTGLEVLRQMREKNILLPVILLTAHADIRVTVDAMRLGAIDVLEKPVDNAELIAAVQAAFAKAEHLHNLAKERAIANPKIEMLTKREMEVLDHMVAGKRNRKIAEVLGISPKTVDIHRANIMRKLHTKAVADLVRWRIVSQVDSTNLMPVIARA